MRWLTTHFATTRLAFSWLGWLILVLGSSCGGPAPLTVNTPLHLEEHLEAAVIVGSEVPADVPQPVVWDFDQPQPAWQATRPRPFPAGIRPAAVSQTDDALRIVLGAANANPNGRPVGGVFVDVPEWDHRDWAHVVVRARSSGPGYLGLGFNILGRGERPDEDWPNPYAMGGQTMPLVGDSTVQSYQILFEPYETWNEPVRQLGLWLNCPDSLEVEVPSISVVPTEAAFNEEPAGGQEAERGQQFRRSLFVHTPAHVEYQVRIPREGRLDLGLGTLRSEPAITFRVTVTPDGALPDTLLDESYSDRTAWAQRSVDLSAYPGRVVTLALEAESERQGSVALWGAPTLSGPRVTAKPNVIFYVIDGAGAEYLSVYGYHRRTTPNLERLAAEGAVFEWAYSNSSWTRPSTASFMTSLQNSVIGGAKGGFNVVPDNARTMAQHMHQAGYQTGVFTANPNAGKMSGLEREVDSFEEGWAEFSYGGEIGNWNRSSIYLHEAFWDWRDAYPAEPYWVHFQTVDIHGDFPAPAPFGGLFVNPEAARWWKESGDTVWQRESGPFVGGTETRVNDWAGFFAVEQGLYDEALAHNDYQLGRLVQRLKADGEWENTLLVIAADHSIRAAGHDYWYLTQDSLPPAWTFDAPHFRPTISRVPLMFIWPGHIEGGQRFAEPTVSMLDVLPTILDLVGLPLPEIMQGQSLAPVLLGTGPVESRPVILDEFSVDPETGELRGTLEVVDGRWGASLQINPAPPDANEPANRAMWRRPAPLLVYDLWSDPYCLHSLHEERPDLVEKYTAFLQERWEAHQTLATYFTPGENVALTAEQLETLRALGYIQ